MTKEEKIKSLPLCVALFFGLYYFFMFDKSDSLYFADIRSGHKMLDLTNFLDNPAAFNEIFGEKVVFFIESTDKGKLDARKVCSIEALNSFNPDVKIILVFINNGRKMKPIKSPALTELLSRKKNIILALVNNLQVFKGTPLEGILSSTLFQDEKQTEVKEIRLSNFLRLCLLWKLGGVYMDLDFLLFKNINSYINLQNFLIADTKRDRIKDPIMGFQRNHPFLKTIMETLGKKYIPLHSNSTLPTLNVTTFGTVEEEVTRHVGEVQFLDRNFISPVRYGDFFDESKGELTESMMNESLGVHLWHFYSFYLRLRKDSIAPYAIAARKFCPRSFDKADEFF
ncbi:lactosylceramide 4-alpha-galactosyltransferase-like [Neocloeon triangulifer]|uniref:lactosylceramide 4-alpha-galactosyltransferase-like n=1 Tax=Neocloeon triangulifer TaxID=2078957 RepID=UPI00286EFA00|nr:lactosylceramide 4-alpha-galactosyltransferase-like [Neocloeon triangulifer]